MHDRKENRIAIVLIGVAVCIMISLMYFGGEVNFRCFLGEEHVYDFPQTDLVANANNWQYEQENASYFVLKENSKNKYLITGKEETWGCLYLTVGELSQPTVDATIIYYNEEGENIVEQPIQLHEGENLFFLYDDIPMYKMGIRLLDFENGRIAFTSMQLRDNVNNFTLLRFTQVFGITFGVFLMLMGIVSIIRRKHSVTRNDSWLMWMFALQQFFIAFGNNAGEKFIKGKTLKTRYRIRCTLWCIFFLWLIFFQIMGWSTDAEVYRYFMLGSAGMILMITITAWERTLHIVRWNTGVAKAWLALCVLLIFSDIFVDSGNKFVGYLLLFVGGIFAFVWNQMEYPASMLICICEALQIVFWLVTVFCVLFRNNKITTFYNGVFSVPEYFAMYGLLMLAVFLTEICRCVEKPKVRIRRLIYYYIGATVALYFSLRSGSITVWISLVLIGIIFLTFMVPKLYRRSKGIYVGTLCAILLSFCMVSFIHLSVKYVPVLLGTNIEIENEQLISKLSTDELNKYKLLFPDELAKVVSWDSLDILAYQKGYARKLSLTGNISKQLVYREEAETYSGYLYVMYRYGIFAIVPFLLYQIYSIQMFTKCKWKSGVWYIIIFIDIIYVCSCIVGNTAIALEHPLTWCFYLMNGCLFIRPKKREK